MSFLPVVQRELLVAARKRATFWGRTASAGLALAFCVALYAANYSNPTILGPRLIQCLSALVFLECMIAGLRYTSDCLSEEKREGTLGLLFLTNLSGLDVVLGKMMGRSLRAIYNLLAVIPILALPLMVGGVTGGQVAARAVVLLVCTIFSLSAGAFISSCGVRERTVLTKTLVLLIIFTVAPRILREIGLRWSSDLFEVVGWFSPLSAFIEAGRGWVPQVKMGCATLLLMSAFFVGFASWRIRRERQSEVAVDDREKVNARPSLKRRKRDSLLTLDPFFWLARKARTKSGHVTLFCGGLLLFGVFCRIIIEKRWNIGEPFVIFGTYGLHALFKFLVVAETCRQLNEDRRSGALELLLATPIHARSILQGQIRATVETWLPVGACLALMNGIWMTERNFLRDVGIMLPCSVVLIFVDSHALMWRGLLNALKGERYARTVFRTFFEVILPPLALVVFLFTFLAGSSARKETVQAIFLVWTAATVTFDFALARRTREQLVQLRSLASEEGTGRGTFKFPGVRPRTMASTGAGKMRPAPL